MADGCFVCGERVEQGQPIVLVDGKVQRVHCSRSCLHETVRVRRRAAAATRRRWLLAMLLIVALPATARVAWRRYRAPPPEAIASAAPEGGGEAVLPVEPARFGPAWPPTDEDWTFAFNDDAARWVYPLPGPARRAVTTNARLVGPRPRDGHTAVCRQEGRCGVDLGGELWGEHVHAAHDGVVERVQAGQGEQGGQADGEGGQYVRLSHFGGMVFTQYFHLAAIPRGLVRGTRVAAGDIIGLLGDTGIGEERRHLHFTLSIRPSSQFAETYWDPTPWMDRWQLRVSAHGTVAGLVPSEAEGANSRRRRSK